MRLSYLPVHRKDPNHIPFPNENHPHRRRGSRARRGGRPLRGDPHNSDSDGDGLPDGWEVANGIDPLDDGSIDPNNGAAGDPDGDDTPNSKEWSENTNPQDPGDFEPEWVWVTNRVDGHTGFTSTVSDLGEINHFTWNGEPVPKKFLEEALQPSTVHDELVGMSFPNSAAEALEDAFGNVDRIGVNSGDFAAARARFYKTPSDPSFGFSDATYNSTRVWLHVPPTPLPRSIPFMKLTYHSRSGAGISTTTELVDAEGLNVNLSPYASWSDPVDLDTSTESEHEVTHSHWVYLSRLRIVPDQGMAGVVGDVVESMKKHSFVTHFVTPKQTSDINQSHVELRAEGFDATRFSDFLEWDGDGVEAGSAPDRCKVPRTAAGKTEVTLKTKSDGEVVAKMIVWVVWAEVTARLGAASFDTYQNNAGVKFEVPPQMVSGGDLCSTSNRRPCSIS